MFYSVTSVPSPTSLSIIHIGFSDETSITRWGPGRRSQYIIHYVIDGEGVYNGNVVKKGQGFIKPPDHLEKYRPNPDNPWSFFWIVAEGSDMENLLPYCGADPDTLIFDFSFSESIKKVQETIKMMNRNIASPFELLEIFWEIFKNHDKFGRANQSSNECEIYTNYAKNYIETNYAKKITVSDLTDKLGISQPYLFRLFMDAFGKSPKQYINDYRLTQAKILLTQTDMTVSQVAKAVGYDDALAFSKFFSTHEGMSPSVYKDTNS